MVGSLIHLQMIDFPLFPMKPPVQATHFQTRPKKIDELATCPLWMVDPHYNTQSLINFIQGDATL